MYTRVLARWRWKNWLTRDFERVLLRTDFHIECAPFMIYCAEIHSRENPISLFKIAETKPTRTWERYMFKTVWRGTPLSKVSLENRKDLIFGSPQVEGRA